VASRWYFLSNYSRRICILTFMNGANKLNVCVCTLTVSASYAVLHPFRPSRQARYSRHCPGTWHPACAFSACATPAGRRGDIGRVRFQHSHGRT
jgi:hypothetical protein